MHPVIWTMEMLFIAEFTTFIMWTVFCPVGLFRAQILALVLLTLFCRVLTSKSDLNRALTLATLGELFMEGIHVRSRLEDYIGGRILPFHFFWGLARLLDRIRFWILDILFFLRESALLERFYNFAAIFVSIFHT